MSVAVISATIMTQSPVTTIAEETPVASLQEQLSALKEAKIQKQKEYIETTEQALMTKELQYPEGKKKKKECQSAATVIVIVMFKHMFTALK